MKMMNKMSLHEAGQHMALAMQGLGVSIHLKITASTTVHGDPHYPMTDSVTRYEVYVSHYEYDCEKSRFFYENLKNAQQLGPDESFTLDRAVNDVRKIVALYKAKYPHQSNDLPSPRLQ